MLITSLLEVLLVLRASWMWQEGIKVYGLEAGLRVIGDIFLMIAVLAVSSILLDRLGNRWIQREIDERAGEVTALTRQFKKLDSQWRWEGNTLTRGQFRVRANTKRTSHAAETARRRSGITSNGRIKEISKTSRAAV